MQKITFEFARETVGEKFRSTSSREVFTLCHDSTNLMLGTGDAKRVRILLSPKNPKKKGWKTFYLKCGCLKSGNIRVMTSSMQERMLSRLGLAEKPFYMKAEKLA